MFCFGKKRKKKSVNSFFFLVFELSGSFTEKEEKVVVVVGHRFCFRGGEILVFVV